MSGILEPAELVALASELEKEGQYNTAKLVRAAAVAAINRDAFTRQVPTDPAGQATSLEALAKQLTATHVGALSEPLRAAAAALRANQVALVDDAPDPYVCRICGELRSEPFNNRCRHCGRWPTTAERIRPISWLRESDPAEAIERLRHTQHEVERLLDAGNNPRYLESGPDGGWSAHQVLEHLHNAQGVFRGRIDQFLAGGDPELASVMVWAMDGTDIATPDLIRAYTSLRAEIVDVLSGISSEVWWHTGHHAEWGRVSLAEQASYFANHEPTHLAQLADAAR